MDTLLARTRGVVTRTLLQRIGWTRHEMDNALRRGDLVALSRGTYCRPWDVDQVDVVERAAALSLAPACALSHLSALRRWGLPVPASHAVHVIVPSRRCPRVRDGVVEHRAATFPPVVQLDGVVTITAPIAIAGSWRLLPATDRRPCGQPLRRSLA